MMLVVFLLSLILTPVQDRPSIVAKPSEPPGRNFYVIYYDHAYLFAARHYGNAGDAGGNTEPGLFVHSKKHDRWLQILKISTLGGQFGKSSSDDPEVMKKMKLASVGWDFTGYANKDYIEQPLRTSGSISFPEKIEDLIRKPAHTGSDTTLHGKSPPPKLCYTFTAPIWMKHSTPCTRSS